MSNPTPNTVSVPEKKNSFSTPSNGDGAGNGAAIKGFGSGKPDSSTVNAGGGSLAKTDKTPGKSVTGFSSSKTLPGKI